MRNPWGRAARRERREELRRQGVTCIGCLVLAVLFIVIALFCAGFSGLKT